MDAGVFFFFLFVFKRRKEDIMLPLMGKGGIDLSYMLAFQKERSEKNDLVPRLFPSLFQKEKRKRLSVILSVEKREEKKMRSRDFLFLFLFKQKAFRKERKGGKTK